MKNIQPVIMAGGSGTRLWPLSRSNYPKQFLPLVGEQTMLQQTLQRAAEITPQPAITICNEVHRFIAAEQIEQSGFGHSGLLLEPCAKNTAPAIALAALHALQAGGDPLLLVLAADHHIQDVEAFQRSVNAAIALAKQDKLVTFGIVPTRAETGYGYIKQGMAIADGYAVAQFVEKPEKSTARKYLESGEYLWNSGMFMFKASVFLDELERFAPAILEVCQRALNGAESDLDFIRISRDAFEACPSDSVDYAVMEKTEHATVVPLDAGWDDIGGFKSLWAVTPKDSDGNALHGGVHTINSQDCLVYSDERVVAALGVKDLVVVDTKDALLVAHKDHAQDVKQVVANLREKNRDEAHAHREVARPWGSYDLVDEGKRFKVKRIKVKPGAKLSVQKHHHRAEHWVVVKGVARVTNGDDVYLVSENESTYIPIGQVHALENPGSESLELIEVQSGDYLGEDDIVRLEDRYGRLLR